MSGAYHPNAVIKEPKPPQGHGQMRAIGKWVAPDDWTGRWCWDRYTTSYRRNGKMHEVPNLYWVADYHVYARRLGAEVEAERWKDAKELPAHLREAMLDCYEGDLTQAMREICAEQIAARAAAKAAPARKPATAPRAAPKKKPARRSRA